MSENEQRILLELKMATDALMSIVDTANTIEYAKEMAIDALEQIHAVMHSAGSKN